MSFRRSSPSEIGAEAETQACAFLERKGYVLLDRNHRLPFGELDLVMRDGETVVFVEVRRRSNAAYGRGFETVTWKKQAKLAMAAMSYVKAKGLSRAPLRFDIVSMGSGAPEHIPNAFVPAAGRYTI